MSILTDKKGSLELLCPAGDLTRLKTAVDFGADAVYIAGEEFGMRTASANFNNEDLKLGVEYAHAHGVKVHVACNVIPHEDEIARIPQFLTYLNEIGVDAVIASDLGTIGMVKEYAPNCELHISVQSGIVNSATATAFYNMGAKRVVLARELSLEEIKKIRENTPPELEIEAFAHGAMCVSFSARCLLSSYMTGRDANRGDCAQPCRWSYNLVEEKRDGQLFNITENEKGTYILNANDMCMAAYLDKIKDAGVCSIKIEGRAKTEYYVAVTANAYRGAIDSLDAAKGEWQLPAWVADELDKISHRTYSTGFYFGRPENAQSYKDAGYIRNYAIAAVVDGYQDGCIIATLKNKFASGTILDCLEAGSAPFDVDTTELYNEDGIRLESANSPMMQIKIPFEREIKTGSMLRMKI
ncbi:MAG: U32 family peptidase [Clostridia bacterium]|nr:U32 family peptidase [Clostridia bacterium]